MNIAFDVKLWTVVRVDVPDGMEFKAAVALAEAIAKEKVDCLDIGQVIEVPEHQAKVTLTEASSEGQFELMEVDGEDPYAWEYK